MATKMTFAFGFRPHCPPPLSALPPFPYAPLVSIIFTSQVSSWATCVAYPGELNWTSQQWTRMWKEQHQKGDVDEDVDVDDFHVEHALIS